VAGALVSTVIFVTVEGIRSPETVNLIPSVDDDAVALVPVLAELFVFADTPVIDGTTVEAVHSPLTSFIDHPCALKFAAAVTESPFVGKVTVMVLNAEV
jgi:hypothetical protein